jgi:hypothetical protein
LEDAKKAFHKKFKDKTGQDFGLVFVHKGGKFYNCSVQAPWENCRAAPRRIGHAVQRMQRAARKHTRQSPLAAPSLWHDVDRTAHPHAGPMHCRAQHEERNAYMSCEAAGGRWPVACGRSVLVFCGFLGALCFQWFVLRRRTIRCSAERRRSGSASHTAATLVTAQKCCGAQLHNVFDATPSRPGCNHPHACGESVRHKTSGHT